MAQWDPQKYLVFEEERTQPARDLVARVQLENPQQLIDLGCGPGNSTAIIAERFPQTKVLGLDFSEAMIEAAQLKYPTQQQMTFLTFDADAGDYQTLPAADLIFSNACIQWVPNHPKLFKNLFQLLKKDGILALQLPVNFEEPIHQIIKKTVESPSWCEKLADRRQFYTLTEAGYFDLLSQFTPDFTMWKTIYFHRLKNHDALIEWYQGTGLRPYLGQLTAAEQTCFLAEIKTALEAAYPPAQNGEIIFRFPRLFMKAKKL